MIPNLNLILRDLVFKGKVLYANSEMLILILYIA